MKKDELIEKLLKIEGNPEIVIPESCGDFLTTKDINWTTDKTILIF